jgi:hypothetical protein
VVLVLRFYGQRFLVDLESEGTPDEMNLYYIAVLVGNILCVAMHFFFRISRPGEATHGYLHGGLLLDFVGQVGTASTLQLLIYDIIILIIQLVFLDVSQTRKMLAKQLSRSSRSSRRSEAASSSHRTPTFQDMDAEERGAVQEQELEQDLSQNFSFSTQASETLYSGQADIGSFWMFKIVRDKYAEAEADISKFRGPSLALSNVVGINIRRRRYTLNLPFRS